MKILKTIIVIMIIAITKCFLLSFCCICLVCYTQVTSGINSWTSLSFHQILFAMGPWSLIYFLSIVLFGRFYLINLVLAVVAASYENEVQNSRQVSHKIFRRNSEIWCFNAISETRSIWPGAKLDQNKFLENVLLVSPQMDQIPYLTRRLPMRIRPQTSVLY